MSRKEREAPVLLNVISLSFQEEPHLPYEFTHVGMLERVKAYLENQVRTRIASRRFVYVAVYFSFSMYL